MLVYILGRSRNPKRVQVPGVECCPAAAPAPVGYLRAWIAAKGVISCACQLGFRLSTQRPPAPKCPEFAALPVNCAIPAFQAIAPRSHRCRIQDRGLCKRAWTRKSDKWRG